MYWKEVSVHLRLGPKPCTILICRSLALVEMKTLLRDIYGRFTTNIAPEMSSDMSIDDQIIASRPKDQKCLLTFQEVSV
jgi:hypothetical protein